MNGLHSKLRALTAMICLASMPLTSVTGFGQAPAAPNRMFIQILDGEGALNDIRERTAREPIVEIQDENHKPIAGAVVIFTTPGSGPSATFANGLTTFQTTTLADGRATATGFKPNTTSGSYQIQVSATFGSLSTVAVINEINASGGSSAPPRATRTFPIKVVAIVGTLAAGGIIAGVLATQGHHSDTVTAGTPTVGAP